MSRAYQGGSDRDSEQSPRAALIAAVRSCEPGVWEELVRRLGPRVRKWARWFGLNREDAADTEQGVFLALVGHAAELNEKMPDRSFLAWLRKVARNLAGDHFRAHRVESEAAGGDCAQALLAEAPDRVPPDGADGDHRDGEEWALEREAVRRGLAAVEERTSRPFLRHVADERPAKEVAAELGMTVAAVHLAKQRLIGIIRRERDALANLRRRQEKTG